MGEKLVEKLRDGGASVGLTRGAGAAVGGAAAGGGRGGSVVDRRRGGGGGGTLREHRRREGVSVRGALLVRLWERRERRKWR